MAEKTHAVPPPKTLDSNRDLTHALIVIVDLPRAIGHAPNQPTEAQATRTIRNVETVLAILCRFRGYAFWMLLHVFGVWAL